MPTAQPLKLRAQDLEGKVAVVTGASRGIGRAIAINLASRGCSILGTCSSMQTVHLIDTLSHTVSGLFAEVPGLKKPKVVGIAADITTAECADKIAKALEKHFQGHVDILVNNAALIKSVKLGEMDAEVVQAMLFANVQTPLMIVNELVKKKMFRKDSRIVNISSDSAHNNPFRPGRALYPTVKSALEGLARAWADELGDNPELEFMSGTTANAVSVGVVNTDTNRRAPPQMHERVQQVLLPMQSLGSRTASTEDIADAVGFLCGRDSRWVTGQVIGVNGGFVKIA